MSTISAKIIIQFIIFCFIAVNVCRVKGLKSESNDENQTRSQINESEDDYYNDYENTDNIYISEDYCRNYNTVLSQLFEIHNKNKDIKIVKNVQNMSQTLGIIDRLSQIAVNLSKDAISSTDSSKLIELFLSLEVPIDCLTSLVEIFNAIRKEELWAIKC